jgi:hypothetical protein
MDLCHAHPTSDSASADLRGKPCLRRSVASALTWTCATPTQRRTLRVPTNGGNRVFVGRWLQPRHGPVTRPPNVGLCECRPTGETVSSQVGGFSPDMELCHAHPTSDSASADLRGKPCLRRSVVEDPDVGPVKPSNLCTRTAPKPANVGLCECRRGRVIFILGRAPSKMTQIAATLKACGPGSGTSPKRPQAAGLGA